MWMTIALAGFADPGGPALPESDWSLAQCILAQSAPVLLFVTILGSLLMGHRRFLSPLHEGYQKTIYGFVSLGIFLSLAYSSVTGLGLYIFSRW